MSSTDVINNKYKNRKIKARKRQFFFIRKKWMNQKVFTNFISMFILVAQAKRNCRCVKITNNINLTFRVLQIKNVMTCPFKVP